MSTLSFAPASLSNGDCFTTIDPNSVDAPARMEDGRGFTDYRPRCLQYPLKVTGQWGEHDGRQKMIQATNILQEEARQTLRKKMGPVQGSCVDTMVPELYKRVCTWRGCETVPGHYAGIGTGRVYVPNAAVAAGDADGLAKATIPAMVNTYSMEGSERPSQCAADDKEKLWAFLDTPQGYSARSTPYSGPRA
jgi:hypothetical protein